MDNVEKVENTEQDDNTNGIEDLIKASLANDYNNANKIFGEVMTIKMSDLLDQEKIRMADQVYNGVEPEEEEDVPEDEDLADEAEAEAEAEVEEGEENEEEEDVDPNEHTHEDGTTHSHEGGDQEHTHEEEIEGAAV